MGGQHQGHGHAHGPATEHDEINFREAKDMRRYVSPPQRRPSAQLKERGYLTNAPGAPFHTGAKYPQACANWRSIATNHGWRTVPCPDIRVDFNAVRGAVKTWSDWHHSSWRDWIVKSAWAPYAGMSKDANCQVDEWPPFGIWGNRDQAQADAAFVRYLPGGQNGGSSLPNLYPEPTLNMQLTAPANLVVDLPRYC